MKLRHERIQPCLFWERAFQAEGAELGQFKGLKACPGGAENVTEEWQEVELERYVSLGCLQSFVPCKELRFYLVHRETTGRIYAGKWHGLVYNLQDH